MMVKLKNLCKCGCKEIVSPNHIYVWGHNTRAAHPMKGKHHKPESIAKISLAKSGQNNPLWGTHCSYETKMKISKANKGHHMSKEHKEKFLAGRRKVKRKEKVNKIYSQLIRLCECGCGGSTKPGNTFIQGHMRRGKPHDEETRLRMSASHMGKPPANKGKKRLVPAWNKGIKGSIPSWNKGLTKETDDRIRKYGEKRSKTVKGIKTGRAPWNKGLTKETDVRVKEMTEKTKVAINKLWSDPVFAKKQTEAMNVKLNKPNNTELKLNETLDRLYPNEWKYVGNGKLVINGKCPDFVNVNGQKKIIELFGNYWHEGDDPEDRKKVFEPFGYKTLVVWENELKKRNWLEFRIHKFMRE